jgi:hypothetical protein
MAKCETCGNDYRKAFQVVMDGTSHTFDCFECAIQALAPACGHCGCAIIGHGVERGTKFYCCDHCAPHAGIMPIDEQESAVDQRQRTEAKMAH